MKQEEHGNRQPERLAETERIPVVLARQCQLDAQISEAAHGPSERAGQRGRDACRSCPQHRSEPLTLFDISAIIEQAPAASKGEIIVDCERGEEPIHEISAHIESAAGGGGDVRRRTDRRE